MIPLAIDTETIPLRPGCIAPEIVCVSSQAIGEDEPQLTHWRDAYTPIAAALTNPELLIVGHNIAYDFGVIAAQWPDLLQLVFEAYEVGRVSDTMIREQLIDTAIEGRPRVKEKGRFALDKMAQRRCGIELDKAGEWRMSYGLFRDVPISDWPEGAKHYAKEDARATISVWEDQLTCNIVEDSNGLLTDESAQCRAAWWLHLTSTWGLRTDPAAVDRLFAQLQADLERLRAQLQAAGIVRQNGTRDVKAVEAYLTERYPETPRNRKSGRIKTDKGTLSKIFEQHDDPVVGALQDFQHVSKMINTDLAFLTEGTRMPIHTRFGLAGTGRTTSSKPNVQNLPRKYGVRECFVPRQGRLYVSADYSGLELCTLAQTQINLFGRSMLADMLNGGTDPHCAVAAEILSAPYDVIVARRRNGDREVDLARQTGKVANFGFPGGLGYTALIHFARMSYGVKLTEDQARSLKATWFRVLPDMRDYFDLISNACDNPAGLTTVRQLVSGRVRGNIPYTVACNTFFQGLGADATKAAGWLISKACYVDSNSTLFGCRIVNFVHDEFILEVPEGRQTEAGAELSRLMIAGARPYLPDLKIEAEPVCMRRWYKSAEPVRDAAGNLLPWEPEQ